MKKTFRVAALMAASAFAATAMAAAPALAAPVGDGTVSVAELYNPAVSLTSTGGTFTANNGQTFEISGTGAFTSVAGLMGSFNGILSFSNTPGVTLPETVSNFFTFNDGKNGMYDFSVASVSDISYSNVPGVSSAVSLYLLGTTVDTHLGDTATPTSLTLSFNSNGGSAYSSSATLSVPPSIVSGAPEPGIWALMIAGIGFMGAALRFGRRRDLSLA